ncbi:hypothetical protein BS50DRAFT_507719 [Corynespora cassiicola Philippines]|uniref:Xylanolytic transcriptional activator regulatory domain-containing protein n=1 Tax=Corynespora cassiicola Philippines TaxID=1448308 RepID=A0A2T2N2X8_CORCC|nr:hypothetical protein BS50DRAFT_507719 [Corynespora cassiicola Philippines]
MQDLEEFEPSTQRESHLKNTYFYLDGDPVEIDMSVNPYEVPDLDTADRLFQCFLEAVMGWLPIIPLELMNQIQNWYDTPYQTPKQWRAIMNLIFSIGSRYSDLLKDDDALPSDDHALYMSKAVRLLELNDTLMTLSAPDLPMVQFFAILSFYYLITGHANRAWTTIGISVRCAISCDLHLRNNSSSPPNDNDEDLSRTWWSLQHLECLLSTITGRPCGIYNTDFNISLPKGLLKSPGRYSPGFLTAQIKLGLITRRALVSLYSVRAAVTPWQDIQKSISTLSFEMDEWSRMTFSDENCSILSLLSEREKKILEFGYLSTKMLLTRPCLSRPKQQSEDNDDAVSFDQRMACVCVQTAQDLSRLLPESSDTRIIGEGPWWCIVHYIMQALAVLFLEISSGSTHVSNTKINVTSPMKKLFDWLKFLRKRDSTAERALKVVGALLKRAHHLDDISVMLWNDQADTYGGHLVQSHMWQENYLDNLSSYPQFPPSFNQLPGNSVSDMSADFDFFMDPMPFPPVYGNAFADDILANSN